MKGKTFFPKKLSRIKLYKSLCKVYEILGFIHKGRNMTLGFYGTCAYYMRHGKSNSVQFVHQINM